MKEEGSPSAVSIESDSNAPTSMHENENELQPTPPPRKKKLKKKLEQLVEEKLNLVEDFQLKCGEDSHGEDSLNHSEDSDVKIKDPEEVSESTQTGAGESSTASPKKSRRRKKHTQ